MLERPLHELRAARHSQLAHQMRPLGLGGSQRDLENLRDVAVRVAVGEQHGGSPLTFGEEFGHVMILEARGVLAVGVHAERGAENPRGDHLFGGRLDKEHLRPLERALTGALHVPGGDYREWDAVAAWATAIARVLTNDVYV